MPSFRLFPLVTAVPSARDNLACLRNGDEQTPTFPSRAVVSIGKCPMRKLRAELQYSQHQYRLAPASRTILYLH